MGNDNGDRKLPTRAGWWLIKADPRDTSGGLPYEAVVVYQGRGGLLVSGRTPNRVDQNGGIDWLAPIPGPEACAALAEYGDAVMQRGPTQARGVSVSSALLALEDAIRAERNGAA